MSLVAIRPEAALWKKAGVQDEWISRWLVGVSHIDSSSLFHPLPRLPISHTCFNQICLPPYRTRKELKHKLTIAISNSEGFGLE